MLELGGIIFGSCREPCRRATFLFVLRCACLEKTSLGLRLLVQSRCPNLKVGVNLVQIDRHNVPANSPSGLEDSGISAQAAYRLLEGALSGGPCNGSAEEKLAKLLQDIATLLELARREGISDASQKAPLLTQRPQEVLQLIHFGMTPTEIGKELHISVKTVRRHIEILKCVLNEPHCHYRKLPTKAQELGIL